MDSLWFVLRIIFGLYIGSVCIYALSYILLSLVMGFRLSRLSPDYILKMEYMVSDSNPDRPKTIFSFMPFTFMPVIRLIMLIVLCMLVFNPIGVIDWVEKRIEEEGEI